MNTKSYKIDPSKLEPCLNCATGLPLQEVASVLHQWGCKYVHLDVAMAGTDPTGHAFSPAAAQKIINHLPLLAHLHLWPSPWDETIGRLSLRPGDIVSTHGQSQHLLPSSSSGLVIEPSETEERQIAPTLASSITVLAIPLGSRGHPPSQAALRFTRELAGRRVRGTWDGNIVIDGGARDDTLLSLASSGADRLVVGSWLFRNCSTVDDVKQRIMETSATHLRT